MTGVPLRYLSNPRQLLRVLLEEPTEAWGKLQETLARRTGILDWCALFGVSRVTFVLPMWSRPVWRVGLRRDLFWRGSSETELAISGASICRPSLSRSCTSKLERRLTIGSAIAGPTSEGRAGGVFPNCCLGSSRSICSSTTAATRNATFASSAVSCRSKFMRPAPASRWRSSCATERRLAAPRSAPSAILKQVVHHIRRHWAEDAHLLAPRQPLCLAQGYGVVRGNSAAGRSMVYAPARARGRMYWQGQGPGALRDRPQGRPVGQFVLYAKTLHGNAAPSSAA